MKFYCLSYYILTERTRKYFKMIMCYKSINATSMLPHYLYGYKGYLCLQVNIDCHRSQAETFASFVESMYLLVVFSEVKKSQRLNESFKAGDSFTRDHQLTMQKFTRMALVTAGWSLISFSSPFSLF